MKIKTLVMVLFIAIIFTTCSPAPASQQIETSVPKTSSISKLPNPTVFPNLGWEAFNSESFLITFEYPKDWKIDNTGVAASGQDGFFSISATSIGGATAKEVCDNDIQVNHSGKENRYGTKPTLDILLVDNQPACLILPSDDQPQDKHKLSLLVVEYPDLNQGHLRLLQLFADKNHVRDFISTLKFIR